MHRNRCSSFSSGDCRGVRSVSFVVSLTTADIPADAGLQCDKAVMVREIKGTAVTLQSPVQYSTVQAPEHEPI
jgi:hypothetical protein